MTEREEILKALEIIKQSKELRKQGKVKKLRRRITGRSKFTPRIRAIADDIARDYERGVKIVDIRRKYRISDNTLYKILSERGIELRGKGSRPHISTKDLRALVKYLKGVKVRRLAISKLRLIKIKQYFGLPSKREDLDDEKREKVLTTLENFLKNYRYKIVILPMETVEELRKKIKELLE